MSSRNKGPGRSQPTPDDLLQDLLAFLQRKFYPDRPKQFAQDRRRLLQWVILWPAKWLNERGVTLPADRYRELFMNVFMDGLRFGNTGNITYLPAWLAKVIQSHFSHHGDEIYAEAKSMRSMVENAMALTGKVSTAAPDPVRTLAQAASLLRKKPSRKPSSNAQLNLFATGLNSPKSVSNLCQTAPSAGKTSQTGKSSPPSSQVLGNRAITR